MLLKIFDSLSASIGICLHFCVVVLSGNWLTSSQFEKWELVRKLRNR